MLLTLAYHRGPAAQTGLYTYLAVLFAGLYGWLFWHETPDALALAGMAMVIGAAIWTTRTGAPSGLRPRSPAPR